MYGNNLLCARSYPNYAVRKLECSFTESVQIVSYINLVYATISLICLNAAVFSNLNLLILTLTLLLLVCKPNHIQNLTFYTPVDSGFTYCFDGSLNNIIMIQILKYLSYIYWANSLYYTKYSLL